MKTQPVRVTFARSEDAIALALAELGASTKLIRQQTGLTESQVTYRLHKAKGLEKKKKGYRVAWRDGDSDLFRRVQRDYLVVTMKDIQRKLPVLIEHPPAKTTGDIIREIQRKQGGAKTVKDIHG